MSAQQPSPFGSSPTSNVPVLAAAGVIAAVAALMWFPTVAGLTSLTGSDAAGNGIAQAYTAIFMGFVWLALTALALIAWIKGDMPLPLAIAALLLIPASCFCAFTALELLTEPGTPPYLWAIIVPAGVPPLVIMFSFWALAPPLRRSIPPWIAGGLVWGVTLALCVAYYPMVQIRGAIYERRAEALRKYDEDFAALKADAPLWDWVRFLDTRNDYQRDKVLDGIRHLARRQSEAEIMMDRGDFPIGDLTRFDLDMTPAVCDKARALLRKRAADLMPAKPNTRKSTEFFAPLADAVSALDWLIGYGCNADAEVTAWENTANAYIEPGFDVVHLREMHDPKLLGRKLLEDPERFSMLTPQSHLKAWLKFVDDKDLHDKVLAGARTLTHRTSDAVEMLNDRYANIPAWAVVKYVPVLDLEATPQLCSATLRSVREELTKVYRPRPDDPRPYSELLDRLGASEPLTALVWLGSHGCDVEAEVSTAEAVIGTYRDTQGRAAMLAALAGLHKKP